MSRRVSLIHFSYESPTYERVACSSTAIERKAPRCRLPIFADPLDDMLSFPLIMMKREPFAVADIYVPVKRRATLVQKRVDEIAASTLDVGQQTPILVRADGARFVLVEGLHRLEAAKALGEKTIIGFRVEARKHRMAGDAAVLI
jgi:sulfiredoxin